MTEDAPLSLHDRIRGELQQRILSGDWPPGHRIPSEMELARDYDCARMTVSKAMGELVRAGLILRRRKAGSVVLPQGAQNAILEIHDIRDEVLAKGQAYDFRLLDRGERKLSAEERRAARVTRRGPVVSLTCLHLAGKQPFCLEERVIDPAAVPEVRDESFTRQSPGPWLLQHVPWSEAEHRIGAETAGEARAQSLAIAPDTACLVVERRTWRLGEFVTHVRLSYPGTAFSLHARFAPSA